MHETNKQIIDCFKLLSKQYGCNGLKWKKRAIDKAIKLVCRALFNTFYSY